VVDGLLARGVAEVHAYDPMSMHEARKFFDVQRNAQYAQITYHPTVKSAIAETDALVIATDWEEFRGLSRTIEQYTQKPYLIIDGRRMIPDYAELVAQGYQYLAVGAPLLK
jgi:UDPglucose 6-dehydrogenase